MEISARSVALSITLEGIPTSIHQLLVILVTHGNYCLLNLIHGLFLMCNLSSWFFYLFCWITEVLSGELLVLSKLLPCQIMFVSSVLLDKDYCVNSLVSLPVFSDHHRKKEVYYMICILVFVILHVHVLTFYCSRLFIFRAFFSGLII